MSTDSGRLLAWYGDDFTGSTDALEGLASNGVRAVLFLSEPDPEFFSQFEDYQAFGLAGISRSQAPEWMDQNLPQVFAWLRGLRTPLCHYKVCSTFDSSPQIGNIGRAIEIGRDVFGTTCVPVLVGAPSLRRYVVFGNLFATADGHTWRIDRHPTMSRHPVTPMHESDLTLHLAGQTSLPARSFNILDIRSEDPDGRFDLLADSPGIVLLDTLDHDSLLTGGRMLWSGRNSRPFVTGSSGVEYALIAFWREVGLLPPRSAGSTAREADRLLVVSGSCSPVTQRQIAAARTDGFEPVRLDARALANGDGGESVTAATHAALDALAADRSVVIFTAAGPEDAISSNGFADGGVEFRRRLGEQTGQILCNLLDRSGVRRVVVAGGDTSSHAGRLLGIEALTYVAPIAPGAPLCRAWSRRADRNGLEIVFKGGQCGADNFFSMAKEGRT